MPRTSHSLLHTLPSLMLVTARPSHRPGTEGQMSSGQQHCLRTASLQGFNASGLHVTLQFGYRSVL